MTRSDIDVGRLKRRAEFLHVARGRRVHLPCLTLQAARAMPAEVGAEQPPVARFGFTLTKKVGTATERNRIRRRLREIVRLGKTLSIEPGTDYVVVARRDALGAPFGRLADELETALRRSAARKPRSAHADTGVRG